MSTNYQVSRAGIVKMTANFDKHADGTLWSVGKPSMPLLDGESPEFIAIGKVKIIDLVKAGRFSEIPVSCFAHEGINPSGLEVKKVKSYDDIRTEALAARTPAQHERDRIDGLYAQARRMADSPSDDNVSGPMRIRLVADAALTKWYKDYPAEAREEEAGRIAAQADHEEEVAMGASTYDADGWLDDTDRQARHDEYMAKAVALRAKAAVLRKA